MSITSKFLMSALLVGLSVPAFAQGSTTTVTPAKSSLVHKVSSTPDTTKPAVAPKATAVKPDAAKTTTISTGIANTQTPVAPVAGTPASNAPVVKTN